MRKILLIAVVALLILGLVACTPKNLAEQAIEQQAAQQGEDVDVDIDDDSMTIQNDDEEVVINNDGDSVSVSGEDGNLNMGEGVEWPSDMPANVPEVPGVTVIMVMDVAEGLMVSFEGCDQATADAYIATLKSLGWDALMETTTADGYVLIFESGDESLVFNWYKEEGAGSVTYGMG